MNISTRQLKVFVTVAHAGSLVEASRLLHLTSAALSVSIKTLEQEVGFRVFDRTTRALRLTAEGSRLLAVATTMLEQHEATVHAIEDIRLQRSGRVRIATTQLLSCTLMPPALTRFRAQWPQIEVVQVPALYDNFQGLLLRKEVDMGIGPQRLCDDDLQATPLFASTLYLVCSIHHRFASRQSVQWKELDGEKIFLVDKRGAGWLARDAGYQLQFEHTVDVGHFSTALALASENEGVLFSPGFTRPLLLPYTLAMIPLAAPAAKRSFMLYVNAQDAPSSAAAHLAAHLSQEFHDLT